MKVNYKPGKSEVLLAVHGKGAKAVKARMMGRQDSVLFNAGDGRTQTLRVCYKYTHLGTRLVCGSGRQRDLAVKAAKAKHAVLPLAKHVLRNETIDFATRAKVVSALGLSITAFNIGIWHHCTRGAIRQWTADVASLYRGLLPDDRAFGHPAYPSAKALSGAVGLPFPVSLLIRERVLHWLLLIEQDRCALWELLMCEYSACPSSWLHNVPTTWRFCPTGNPMHVHLTAGRGFSLILWKQWSGQQTTRLWSGEWLSVPSASKREVLANGRLSNSTAVNREKAHLTESPDAPLLLACDQFGATLSSRNALAGHQAKQHASVKLARRLRGGCTRPICLTNFGDHERLIRHLSFSGTCCLAMAASRPQGDPRPGMRLGKSARPSVQAHGPLLPVPSDLEAELFHVVAECSCFDVQALRASVASFDSDLAVALSYFDDSLNLCMCLPEEPTINPDGNALIQKCTHCS